MKHGNSATQKIFVNDTCLLKKTFAKERKINFYQEYFISTYLHKLPIDVTPKIIDINRENNSIYYEYIEEMFIDKEEKTCLYEDLIIQIIENTLRSPEKLLLYSKESFESPIIAFRQIKNRLNAHFNNENIDNKDYQRILNKIKNNLIFIEDKFKNLDIFSELTFSHGDACILNSIVNKKRKSLIIDLEYAGLDSPIKQYIDYLIHPRNQSFFTKREIWSDFFLNELIAKKDLVNLNLFSGFFSLKWSLIVLNEFLPNIWNLRALADPTRINRYNDILKDQLKKSELYLEASQKLIEHANLKDIFSKSERIFLSKSY